MGWISLSWWCDILWGLCCTVDNHDGRRSTVFLLLSIKTGAQFSAFQTVRSLGMQIGASVTENLRNVSRLFDSFPTNNVSLLLFFRIGYAKFLSVIHIFAPLVNLE